MEPLGSYIGRWPRTAAALAFGSMTIVVTHLAWIPNARMSGMALTIAAGVAHALAGAVTGRRLLDGTRTKTSLQAALVGAVTSLLAVAIFSPAFVVFLRTTDVRPSNALSYLLLAVLTSVFSFLGAGWALLLASAGVGWGLYRLAAPPVPRLVSL
jgi:drug/metabolite transporter (DMT)-like permease